MKIYVNRCPECAKKIKWTRCELFHNEFITCVDCGKVSISEIRITK